MWRDCLLYTSFDINGKIYEINGGKIGEVTQDLYDTLTGIQWGKIEDKYNWICKID